MSAERGHPHIDERNRFQGASLTRVSPTRAVISTAGVEVEIVLREWPMPTVRGRQRGIRTRMICPHCESSRDALHWINGEWVAEEEAAETFRTLVVINSVTVGQLLGVSVFGAS